jgi:hypothetical protein
MGERGECLHTPAQCPPEDPLPHATAPAHPSTPPTFTGLVPWEASSQWYRVFIDTGSRPRLWNRGRANETAPVHHPSLGRSGRMAAHGTRAAAERSATDRLSGWEKSPIRRLLSRGNTSPLHNFWHFFRCVPLGTLHPRLAASDASVFSFPWCRLRCAAPVTHQDQGLLTSRFVARRQPLASWMPQKTLGSLPCPIVYNVQIAWLPCGSNFDRAHGRGVAQLGHSAAGPLSRVETGTHQSGWMSTNFSPSLRPQPNGWPDLSQRLSSPQRARGLA